MAVSPEYRAFVEELLEPVGEIAIRRMFGGAGVFHRGLMFGLVAGDTLYLKVDDANRPAFEAAGAGHFEYATKTGRNVLTSYYALPEALYDDPEGAVAWARGAIEAAFRVDAARPKSRRRRIG